ncbi:MAG: DUF4292 domain-containing protein [Cytophagales bacterium]|nr:DUF4292 domain-containing protein [Cytophagales bacterium]
MSRLNVYLFCFLSLLSSYLSACQRKLIPQQSLLDSNELVIQPLDFNYLSLSTKVHYEDQHNSITTNTKLRIQKDSILWFSITSTLGVEVIRGMITKDAMTLINHINRTYHVYDYPTLRRILHFEVSYDLIQAVLLGEVPFLHEKREKIKKNKRQFVINQKKGDLKVKSFINRDFMKLERIEMLETPTSSSLTMAYGRFKKLKENTFAHHRQIVIRFNRGKEFFRATATIGHVKADEKPIRFPFSIPKKYGKR